MMLRRSCALFLLASLLLSIPGCHEYVRFDGSTPPERSVVQLTLTDSGSSQLSGYLGHRISSLSGRYLGTDEQGLALSMASTEDDRGVQNYWQGEHVTVPRSTIANVRVQRISKLQTGLLGLGIGLAVAGTISAFGGNGFLGFGGGSHTGGRK